MKTLNIICGTDYSTFSLNAAIYAMRFARATNSHLRFFHAYPLSLGSIPVDNSEFAKARMKYMKVEQERLALFRDQVLHEMNGEQIPVLLDDLVAEGDPGTALTETAKETKADLVIAATHSYGSREKLLGSNGWKIIKHSKVPVLLIPPGRRYASIKHIVVGAEADEAELISIRFFVKIASEFNSGITVLHISDPEDEGGVEQNVFDSFKEKIRKELQYSKLNIQKQKANDTEEGLNHYCVSSNTDWLIMVHHKKGIFDRIFSPEGSHTRKMSMEARVPLLVVPQNFDGLANTAWLKHFEKCVDDGNNQ